MSSTQTAWTWIEPGAQPRIAAVRDAIADVLPSQFDIESNPHITILPEVILPDREGLQPLRDLSGDAMSLQDRTVYVTGLQFFPDPDTDDSQFDPHVVKLNVDVRGLDPVRQAQRETVHAYDGELVYEPVGPHITIAKSGDGAESPAAGLTADEIAAVRDAAESVDTLFTTTVNEVHTDTCE